MQVTDQLRAMAERADGQLDAVQDCFEPSWIAFRAEEREDGEAWAFDWRFFVAKGWARRVR
jgi:hypothetical protein